MMAGNGLKLRVSMKVKVKVKLPLCSFNSAPRHDVVLGEWRYSSTHSSTSALFMEMSGQLHAPAALPPEKEPLILIGQEAVWAPEPFWTRW
jgi:hypothetical protein